jgi:hypothetical protein
MRILLALALAACTERNGLRRFEEEQAELIGVLVSPESMVVPVGGEAPLTATGLFADRTSGDLTYRCDWYSDTPGVATVSEGLDEEGVLRALEAGRTEVWAGVDDVLSPTVTVTVTEAELDALSVLPSDLTVGVDQKVELEATARWSDGTQSKATSQVRWIIDDPDVAIIDGTKLIGQRAGKTRVRAVWDEVESAEAEVVVVESAAPDLRLLDVSAWSDDGRVTLSLEVQNRGNAGASSFWIDAFLDPSRDPRPTDLGDAFDLVNWVGPGATKTVTLTLDDVDAGDHDLIVLLDSGGVVDESDEDNNRLDATLSIASQEYPADIVVEGFDAVTDGYSVWYWVELSNYGDERTGRFYLDIYLDRNNAPFPGLEGEYYVEVASIDPWDTISFEVEVPESCWGCSSWIQADSLDEIDEVYESDNVAGPVYVW